MKNNKEATLKQWEKLLNEMGLSGTSTTKINIAEMMESEASKLLKEEMEKNNIISDWLNKYGNPEIDKKVEMKLEEMNKEKYNQIIDEVYENYKKEIIRQREVQKKHVEKLRSQGKRLKVARIELLTQEEFINKCKTDPEFSEKWGLKIEERELRPRQRTEVAQRMGIILSEGIKSSKEWDKECDENNVPTKLITLTYNNETIESYE